MVGAQTLYSANQESPVFSEIKSLVTKTVRMHDILRTGLDPLRKKINLAFIYGSVARSGETERSDVDLVVVGRVDFSTVVGKLAAAQKILNREINPTVYTVMELRSKMRGNCPSRTGSRVVGSNDSILMQPRSHACWDSPTVVSRIYLPCSYSPRFMSFE
jgi:predicted nucleotidyltransferase